MKLDDSRRSDNVEDDRGAGGGGIRGIHLGLGGTVLVLVVGYFMGISPATLLGFLNGDPGTSTPATSASPPGGTSAGAANDPQVDFVRANPWRNGRRLGCLFQENG